MFYSFLDLIMENSSIARVSALESSVGESFGVSGWLRPLQFHLLVLLQVRSIRRLLRGLQASSAR